MNIPIDPTGNHEETLDKIRGQTLDNFVDYRNRFCGHYVSFIPLMIVCRNGSLSRFPIKGFQRASAFPIIGKIEKMNEKKRWRWLEKDIANDIHRMFAIESDIIPDKPIGLKINTFRKRHTSVDIMDDISENIPMVINEMYSNPSKCSVARVNLIQLYECFLSAAENESVFTTQNPDLQIGYTAIDYTPDKKDKGNTMLIGQINV